MHTIQDWCMVKKPISILGWRHIYRHHIQFHTIYKKNEEQLLKTFNTLVLSGKLHEATNFILNETPQVILQPNDIDDKTHLPVIDVLKSKHPELKINDITNPDFQLEPYPEVPTPLPIQITDSDVLEITSVLHGTGGPTSLDSTMLKNFLLSYGKLSKSLREEMAKWTELLANTQPNWATYRAAIEGHLVAFNKFPGVRPLCIG